MRSIAKQMVNLLVSVQADRSNIMKSMSSSMLLCNCGLLTFYQHTETYAKSLRGLLCGQTNQTDSPLD